MMRTPSKTKVATEEFVASAVVDTEGVLNKRIDQAEGVLNGRMDQLEKAIEDLDKKQDKRFNMVMNTLDKILKVFVKSDEENTVYRHRTMDNTERIEKIEKEVFAS
jgi:hypothetical protein